MVERLSQGSFSCLAPLNDQLLTLKLLEGFDGRHHHVDRVVRTQ
jgi:hypothetical protein